MKFVIPNSEEIKKMIVLGSDQSISAFWTIKDDSLKGDIKWEKVLINNLTIQNISIFSLIDKLIYCDTFFVFEGDLQLISDVLLKIRRILRETSLSKNDTWKFYHRCTIEIRNEKRINIEAPKLLYDFWPGIYRKIIIESFKRPSYISAYLIIWLYRFYFRKLNAVEINRSRRRFVDKPQYTFEEHIGSELYVEPGIFVPDNVVLSTLGIAFFDPNSPLREDIKGKTVFEPCTGTGILAFALIQMGVKKIFSTDIDENSVLCAQKNAGRLGMSDEILIELQDGLPNSKNMADVVLVNPPWYGTICGIDHEHYLRCLFDPEHLLLKRLLKESYDRTIRKATFYVFLGYEDPLDTKYRAHPYYIDHEGFGWKFSKLWKFNNVRLYRFIKI